MVSSTKLTSIDLPDWMAEVVVATTNPAPDGSDRPNPMALPALALSGMPVSVSSVVGRSRPIDHIERLLGTDRLSALPRTGGCGTTRPALAAAARRCGAFPHGVVFAPLALAA